MFPVSQSDVIRAFRRACTAAGIENLKFHDRAPRGDFPAVRTRPQRSRGRCNLGAQDVVAAASLHFTQGRGSRAQARMCSTPALKKPKRPRRGRLPFVGTLPIDPRREKRVFHLLNVIKSHARESHDADAGREWIESSGSPRIFSATAKPKRGSSLKDDDQERRGRPAIGPAERNRYAAMVVREVRENGGELEAALRAACKTVSERIHRDKRTVRHWFLDSRDFILKTFPHFALALRAVG